MSAVAGFALAGIGWFHGVSLWYGGAALALAALVAIAVRHQSLLEQARLLRVRAKIGRQQLARIARNWGKVSIASPVVLQKHRAEAADLDLMGAASLFQLTCSAHTPLGVETLRNWLLNPAPPEEVSSRQQAAQQLASDRSLREDLELYGRLLSQGAAGPEAFLTWAESEPVLQQRTAVVWLARALTTAVLVALALVAFQIIAAEIAVIILIVLLLANVVLNVMFAGRIHDLFNSVNSRNNTIQHYRDLLAIIARLPDDCDYFRQLKASMGDSVGEPLLLLNQLNRIVTLSNSRRSPLFGVLYLAAQVVLLSDFHILSLMEAWQTSHGAKVRKWLEAIGKLEAAASLATLAHDNPDWCFPEISIGNEPGLIAEQIGHPLLPPQNCVRNDVRLGPPGSFLLVTGSNMSGKSTLLRSVGVNVALAQAGGPVCAADMRLSPMELATSMRVSDSLSDGVSFFMAELQRLKQIVDRSTELSEKPNRTLLFILDEILQGTNSAERRIAVSRVVGSLAENGGIGLVSTHDLELAADDRLSALCRAVHFRETISTENGEQKMTFDYQMRDGVAPTTNALKLLELVGLATKDE